MTLTNDTRSPVPAQRGRTAQETAYEALRAVVKGHVSTPAKESYDALVSPWNLAVPMEPAIVVVPQDAQDVAAAVGVAGRLGLTVGVQATGHGAVSSLAGDVLINTKHLDEVTVDPSGWARVGAGVKWLKVIEACVPLGFAPLNGSSSDVGVVGYTTGGGVGPFTRTYGLAADRVRAFDVVTGDGELRRVTPTDHPDLFFGLRGGKGSLGIVTAVEFDLVPQPRFYGGAVYFDGADADRVVARWRDWSAGLPETATTSFVLFQLPPLPFVPEPLAGKLTIGVRFAYTGDEATGEALFAPVRDAATVILDDVKERSYAEVDAVHADPVDPMPAHEVALLLEQFDGDTAAVFLAHLGQGSGSPQVMAEVRQLGGAYSRPGKHASAFDHRDAGFAVLLVGMPDVPGTVDHAHAALAALRPWAYDGMWPNFGPAHDVASTRLAYGPATLTRLRATAQAYDPHGVLTMGAAVREEI